MHHELPERLDLDWYRKRAKTLVRAYRAGDDSTRARVRESLGERQRFRLGDAQHVIAVEHGFASWGDFKRWVETRQPEPPVGRIGRQPVSAYEDRARTLVDDMREGREDAVRRVRAHVPRLADFNGRELDLRDARIVVAREYGFPTWHDLVFYVEKAIAEYERWPSGELGHAFELIRNGDVDGLRALLDERPELVRREYTGAATTMLEAVAQPDVFGDDLWIELGIDRRIVDLLIERGSELEGPLGLAACFNRAELVQILLEAGARPVPDRIWGLTPLQAAVYHGAKEAGDLLAAVGVVPDALYLAAGAGRLDHVEKWFDERGELRAEALTLRPNLADVGYPPAPPPLDDPQDAVDEAFALAAFNGRREVMERLLERGASIDGTVHLGLTGLHLAVAARRLHVVRWLVEHGADPTRRDGIHDATPLGWAEHVQPGSELHRYLESAP
jgi:hypothetical protein